MIYWYIICFVCALTAAVFHLYLGNVPAVLACVVVCVCVFGTCSDGKCSCSLEYSGDLCDVPRDSPPGPSTADLVILILPALAFFFCLTSVLYCSYKKYMYHEGGTVPYTMIQNNSAFT